MTNAILSRQINKLRALSPQLNLWSTGKGKNRLNSRNEFLNFRETNLIERINELQNQISIQEKESKNKYEGIITELERKLKYEALKHNEARRSYKMLAQTSLNFQSALKDLQKAVKSKLLNVSSFKKVFDERSKQFTQEIAKYQEKYVELEQIREHKRTKRDFSQSKTAGPSPSGSERKHRVKSEFKITSKHLSNRQNDKSQHFEVPDTTKSKDIHPKKLESSSFNITDVTRERDRLQELLIEKEMIITQK